MASAVPPVLLSALCLLQGCGTVETIRARDPAGKLGFDVVPAEARITLDGRSVGRAKDYDGRSSVLGVAAGAHEVLIEAPGYEPWRTKVYLSDTTEVLKAVLKPKP
jgi:hypothetical protein